MSRAGTCRLSGGPVRTCLACGAKTDKSGLLRFVCRAGGLVVDSAQHLTGRGVYCCRSVACLQKFAAKKGRLTRALRSEVADCQAIVGVIADGVKASAAGFGEGV